MDKISRVVKQDITHPAFADIYEWEFGIVAGNRQQEIKFWIAFAEQYGSNLLELGCGTGYITIPLVTRGYNLFAIDNSSRMINALKSKIPPETERTKLIFMLADMQDFHLNYVFDACFIPYSAFQYLRGHESRKNCLIAIHRHLITGGILGIDLDNSLLDPPASMPPTLLYSEYNPQIKAKITMLTSWQTDPDNNIRTWLDRYHLVYSDNTTYSFKNTISLENISLQYITNLLRESDFEILNIYGDYHLNPYGSDSDRLIIIARRN
jgi:SAM-dependent methyltransferase